MLNNLFGGLTRGAGGGEPTTTSPLDRSSLFDDADAVTDFTDHLPPVQGGATITQEDLGAPRGEEVGEAGGGMPEPPVPAPPQYGGRRGNGGGHTPRGGRGILRHRVGPTKIGTYHV